MKCFAINVPFKQLSRLSYPHNLLLSNTSLCCRTDAYEKLLNKLTLQYQVENLLSEVKERGAERVYPQDSLHEV